MNIQTIEELDNFLEDYSGKKFPIPIEGSLGLLALGDIGLQAWRLKIRLTKQALNKNEKKHK